MRKAAFSTLFLALMFSPLPAGAVPEDVSATKHNLSVSGPGPVKATIEDEVCVFCHTPHNASPSIPLWNHAPSAAATYTPYTSSTIDATIGQPDGASKLCLGCHDGTVAVGLTGSRDLIDMVGTGPGGTIPPGSTNLTTDLSDDHPVSFAPDPGRDPEIQLPPAGDPVKLDEDQKVQCTSCHNPHSVEFSDFLVRDAARGEICLSCHLKPGWMGSGHEISAELWPPDQSTSTVADVSCLGCHASHQAAHPKRLLREATEEDTCFMCHQASPLGVGPDMRTEFLKPSRHPVDIATTIHEPVNTPLPAEPVELDRKHVECSDCHNPHRATPENPLDGVRGIRLDGSVAENRLGNVVEEYEVCLRCHGDSYDVFVPPAPVRPPSGSNKRLEFSPGSGSFHPVAASGTNLSVRLATQLSRAGSGLTTTSKIACSDCHNSEATADVQGPASRSTSGPKGPHGSFNDHLLRASYSAQIGTSVTPPFAVYNASNFALCFLCHDERSLTSESDFTATNFGPDAKDQSKNLHAVHLVSGDRASCHECHYNVHGTFGSSNTDPPNAPRLINFAPNVLPLLPNPVPVWRPAGGANGGAYCLLSCHGEDMTAEEDYLP